MEQKKDYWQGLQGANRYSTNDERIAVNYLRSIAKLVDTVGGDLAGFGPYTFDRAASPRLEVLARLGAVQKALEQLSDDLRGSRAKYLAKQLQAINTTEGAPLRLHIGSGAYNLDSWINIDTHPAQLAMDFRWGLPFRDASVAFVFLCHTLEHFAYPREALQITKDIKRVLHPSGVLRIVVPDIEKCLRAYAENDLEFFASRRNTWTWWPERSTKLEDFLAYAGAGAQFGLRSHKFGYDYETLRHLLESAGFRSVERSDYMKSPHEVLRVDNASRVASATYRSEYYSLFVEATA